MVLDLLTEILSWRRMVSWAYNVSVLYDCKPCITWKISRLLIPDSGVYFGVLKLLPPYICDCSSILSKASLVASPFFIAYLRILPALYYLSTCGTISWPLYITYFWSGFVFLTYFSISDFIYSMWFGYGINSIPFKFAFKNIAWSSISSPWNILLNIVLRHFLFFYFWSSSLKFIFILGILFF